jgi:FAD/FMN-containing dehydrogenase
MAGGATPTNRDVVVSLERMASVEQIDNHTATMTVEAGVTLEAAQKAALAAGWFLGLDLGSRSSCQIGGNISTNAGGVRVIKYGTVRNQVTGLEVVLPDGSVVADMQKIAKNNTGYDLKQLFIGAEGTLGIVTRAILRLFPVPSAVGTVLCATNGIQASERLLRLLQTEVGDVSAFEIMWPAYYSFVVKGLGGRTPLKIDMPLYALIEVQDVSTDAVTSKLETVIDQAIRHNLVLEAVPAGSTREASRFWAIRDGNPIDTLPCLINFDLGLSIADMADFVDECDRRLVEQWPDSFRFWFGHIGDGNLHLSVSVGEADTTTLSLLEDIVYSITAQYNGSISAEHGIGRLKRPFLNLCRSDEEIAVMRMIKSAIDPHGIMNPAKVI